MPRNRRSSVYDRLLDLLDGEDVIQESLTQMTEARPHGGLRNINVYRWFSGYGTLPRGCAAFFFFGKDATEGWVMQAGKLTATEKLNALVALKRRSHLGGPLRGIGRALNRAIKEHQTALNDDSDTGGSSTASGSGSYSGSASASDSA